MKRQRQNGRRPVGRAYVGFWFHCYPNPGIDRLPTAGAIDVLSLLVAWKRATQVDNAEQLSTIGAGVRAHGLSSFLFAIAVRSWGHGHVSADAGRAGYQHPVQRPGYPVLEEDVARLSPLIYEHINMLGRYSFAAPEEVARGELRPLRNPEDDL